MNEELKRQAEYLMLDDHIGPYTEETIRDLLAECERLSDLVRRAEQPKPEPVAWREYPEFVPGPDTECLVEAEYGGKLFRAVDTWEMQREAPLEWSSETVEVGYGWSNHDDSVRRWIPIRNITAPPAIPEGYALNIDEMVNRFLCWKLPQDFYPDNFISFDAKAHDRWGGYPQSWPVGTNLLNVQQARQMIEYILAAKVQP